MRSALGVPNTSRALRAQRERLHKRDPRCYLCGQLTVLIDTRKHQGPLPSNMATIDHIYTKFDPRRRQPPQHGERRHFLACMLCNVRRGNPFVPIKTLEEEWRAARQWPRMAYQHGALPGDV